MITEKHNERSKRWKRKELKAHEQKHIDNSEKGSTFQIVDAKCSSIIMKNRVTAIK